MNGGYPQVKYGLMPAKMEPPDRVLRQEMGFATPLNKEAVAQELLGSGDVDLAFFFRRVYGP
eukprot:1417425-Amphidinium_carterae.1